MRQVCNLVYATLLENRDADGVKQLDADLLAVPGEERKVVSKNVQGLVGMMGMPGGR